MLPRFTPFLVAVNDPFFNEPDFCNVETAIGQARFADTPDLRIALTALSRILGMLFAHVDSARHRSMSLAPDTHSRYAPLLAST